MQDSFRLRGRIFFSEDDTRTFREGNRAGAMDYMEQYDIEDSIACMKRDFGRDIRQDISGWWFDQYHRGRYRDPRLYELMARQQELAQAFYAGDRTKHNDVAFFYDEESVHCTAAATLFQMIELNRTPEIPASGMPADFYYHDDIARLTGNFARFTRIAAVQIKSYAAHFINKHIVRNCQFVHLLEGLVLHSDNTNFILIHRCQVRVCITVTVLHRTIPLYGSDGLELVL